MLTDKEIAYIAGMIDGEGCISISKENRKNLTPTPIYGLVVVIANTHHKTLEDLAKLTGLGKVYKTHKNKKGKDSYQWRVYGKSAEELIKLVFDDLRMKTRQAEIALKFRETFSKQGGITGNQKLSNNILELREKYKQEIMNVRFQDIE